METIKKFLRENDPVDVWVTVLMWVIFGGSAISMLVHFVKDLIEEVVE